MDSSGARRADLRAKAKAMAEKPRVLLAACGSVCAVKFGNVCRSFAEWAVVKVVLTKSALRFIDEQTLPQDVTVYRDEKDWRTWKKPGDPVLHIELCNWAEIMVIAPLSANTLSKIGGFMCDNLLTCIVRAPSMNISMGGRNPSREQHCIGIDELGITLIPPSGESVKGKKVRQRYILARNKNVREILDLQAELKKYEASD
ncbi:phosphopantothenoylcysteine decarboxylase-like [Glycine max]|uniref:phosphopantothenoylcysteine decarboxylase-like n=1 Tax=Glycine max TaxID=3847 RepID=UPI000233EB14|nr:phosphopantothenoylcysteine decarboxylase-like [Glycine max]|eukprot:XP_025982687.1 phosphopantothenoylcysteine decarboxylase-like [Glycine max]